MILPILPLRNLDQRHRGVTPAVSEYYLEAARVCLDRHHVSPQEFVISDDKDQCRTQVEWDQTNERIQLAWKNKDDATRDGAYACALAAAELARGLVAVGRAETRTGADYYLAPAGEQVEDLENALRLEVSGTDLEQYEVYRRLREKVEQAANGNSDLPALATVVGFRASLILIQTVE